MITATREAMLLQEINEAPSEEFWERYWQLDEKREDETLTSEEHQELLRMSDEIEGFNVRRLERLVELAQRRQVPLPTLIKDLGLRPRERPY